MIYREIVLGESGSAVTLLGHLLVCYYMKSTVFLWDWLLAQWIYQDRPLQGWHITLGRHHFSPLPSCLFCGLICEEMFQYLKAFSHYLYIRKLHVNNVPLRTVFSWCASEFISLSLSETCTLTKIINTFTGQKCSDLTAIYGHSFYHRFGFGFTEKLNFIKTF